MSDAPDDPNRSTPLYAPPDAVGPVSVATPNDGALPFARVPTHAPASAGSHPAFVPGAPIHFPRRPAPPQLGHPGTLVPLAQFLATLPSTSLGAAALAASRPADVARSSLPPQPHDPPPHASPWGGHAGLTPAAPGLPVEPAVRPTSPAAGPSIPPQPGVGATPSIDPGLSGSSPWLQSQAFVPPALPSPIADLPVASPAPSSVPASAVAASGGSRPLMTVLLVVVAVGLVGAIATIALRSGAKPDDPAEVKAGQAQRDYTIVEQGATSTATSTASAAPPRPVLRAPHPQGSAAPAAPAAKPKDIYDDL